MTHRIVNSYQQQPQESSEMQEYLAPLKSPAIIRDMKQTYVYVNKYAGELSTLIARAFASVSPPYYNTGTGGISWTIQRFPIAGIPINPEVNSQKDPNHLDYGVIINGGNPAPYLGGNPIADRPANAGQTLFRGSADPITIFDRIGTEAKIDLQAIVSDLFDVVVNPDKVVVEVKLVECQISCDPSNYRRVFRDQLVDYDPTDPTKTLYKPISTMTHSVTSMSRAPTDADGGVGQPNGVLQDYADATRFHIYEPTLESSPQPLFCRFKELTDEPYQWSITNSGTYTVDKSHTTVIRFGKVNYSELTLEYGHCLIDPSISLNDKCSSTYDVDNFQGGQSSNPSNYFYNNTQVGFFDDPISFDVYESEINKNTQQRRSKGNAVYYDYNGSYSTEGDFDGLIPAPTFYPRIKRQNYPIFYNQQCSNLMFRFEFKVIHLF